MENIDSKIAALKQQIVDLETRKNVMEADTVAMSAVGRMAEYLHKRFCTSNHTDGCSWHYEISSVGVVDWKAYAHATYLKEAAAIIDYAGSLAAGGRGR